MACRGCKERQEAIARARRAISRREPRAVEKVVKETKNVARSALSDLVKVATKREEDRRR